MRERVKTYGLNTPPQIIKNIKKSPFPGPLGNEIVRHEVGRLQLPLRKKLKATL